jgi:hypothetical protein
MKNNYPSQISFKWQRDAAGYALSGDGLSIERLGGRLEDYDPAKASEPAHRVFAQLDTKIWQDGEIRDEPAGRFEDEPAALLSFVQAHGFLRSPGAEAESVESLSSARRHLSAFVDFGDPETFNRFAPPMRPALVAGPYGRLRMTVAPLDLLGWLWLQTGQDMADGIRWDGAPCAHCGTAMGRGPGAHRADAQYCGDKCRVYAARRKAAKR